MKNLILALMISGSLTACSGGGSGGGGPAGGNISKINENGKHALSGQSALFETSRSLSQGQGIKSQIVSQVLGQSQNPAATSLPDSKAEVQAKADLLNKSIHTTACKVDVVQMPTNGPVSGAAAELQPVKVKISGASCPVEVLMELTVLGVNGANICKDTQGMTACHFTAKVKMVYQVRDEKLANQMGVRSGHIKMNLEMEQTLPSGQTGGMNMAFKGNTSFDLKAVDLEGKAHLISGQQNINMKMLMDSPSTGQASAPQIFGSMKEDLQYLNDSSGVKSALNASLTANGNTSDEKYDIDGNAVTAQAYANERDKFANSMMAFDAPAKENSPSQKDDN